MKTPTLEFDPGGVTKPIQLTSVWFLALTVLSAGFLTAAAVISSPTWVTPFLVLSAVSLVPIFVAGVFLLQTVFRPELLSDRWYNEFQKLYKKRFRGFHPENVSPAQTTPTKLKGVSPDLEAQRTQEYEKNQGLFLRHSWRPSQTSGQVADIIIWLHQHGKGPLTDGVVDKVEYELGRKFFPFPKTKTDSSNGFQIEVSAYAPMLCIAKIHLKNTKNPIVTSRYIDFDEVKGTVE